MLSRVLIYLRSLALVLGSTCKILEVRWRERKSLKGRVTCFFPYPPRKPSEDTAKGRRLGLSFLPWSREPAEPALQSHLLHIPRAGRKVKKRRKRL